jgi:hypothetical protein
MTTFMASFAQRPAAQIDFAAVIFHVIQPPLRYPAAKQVCGKILAIAHRSS